MLSQQLKKIDERFDEEFGGLSVSAIDNKPMKEFILQAIKKVVKETLEEVVPEKKKELTPSQLTERYKYLKSNNTINILEKVLPEIAIVGYNEAVDQINQNIKNEVGGLNEI